MKKERGILAIDLGASSGRLMYGTFDSSTVEMREIHRFSSEPVQAAGKLYLDVYHIFSEIVRGISLCAAQGLVIRSIGLCSFGNTVVLLDRHGDMLMPPLHYRDPSPAEIVDVLYGEVSPEEMFRETLYKPMTIQPAIVLSYLKRARPRAFAEAERVLMISDFFNYLLTGYAHSEKTQAATSQLMDMRTGDWKASYLSRLGLSRPSFPPVIDSGTVIGPLKEELAGAFTEMPAVIAVSGHDTAAAAACVDTRRTEDSLYLSCGTWSCMGCGVEHPVETPELYRDGVTNDLGADGTAQLRFNHTGLWIAEECRRCWEKDGALSWDVLTREAEDAKPFAAVIHTEDVRFFSRNDHMPEEVRSFCRETGQMVPDTRGGILRVIFESLALRYRYSAEVLARHAGTRFNLLHLIGGGSKNSALCAYTASAIGIPVEAGPAEATALGNMMQQALALSYIKTADEGRTVNAAHAPVKRYEPSGEEKWSRQYETALRFFRNEG